MELAPKLPISCRAVFKSPVSDQAEPLKVSALATSFAPGLVAPPTAITASAVAPQPASLNLAVFKSPVSVHALPLNYSEIHCVVVGGVDCPPAPIAEVCVPPPIK